MARYKQYSYVQGVLIQLDFTKQIVQGTLDRSYAAGIRIIVFLLSGRAELHVKRDQHLAL